MSVRVIAGGWRGRRLHTPDGRTTRPLTDRIKQSLFDVLGGRLDDLRVVDVCAGSGGFGFEAASRGAQSVHLIENGRPALAAIAANMRMLGQPNQIRILAQTFASALPTLVDQDLIFADPPFPWFADQPDMITSLLELAAGALASDGAIVIRGERGTDIELPETLKENDRRRYGRSWIAWLSHI